MHSPSIRGRGIFCFNNRLKSLGFSIIIIPLIENKLLYTFRSRPRYSRANFTKIRIQQIPIFKNSRSICTQRDIISGLL